MLKKWIMAVLLGSLMACSQVPAAALKSPPVQVPVTVIYKGNQCLCQQSEPMVKQLSNQAELDEFIRKGSRTILGSAKKTVPSVDFAKDAVVAVWMGKKPTAGYQLSLDKGMAEVRDKTAIIQVKMLEPDGKTVLLQMVTSPCLLVKLPKGQCDSIMVRSQEEDALAKLSIK